MFGSTTRVFEFLDVRVFYAGISNFTLLLLFKGVLLLFMLNVQ